MPPKRKRSAAPKSSGPATTTSKTFKSAVKTLKQESKKASTTKTKHKLDKFSGFENDPQAEVNDYNTYDVKLRLYQCVYRSKAILRAC